MYIVIAKYNYPEYYICDTYETTLMFIRKTFTEDNQGNDYVESIIKDTDEAYDEYLSKHSHRNEILVIGTDSIPQGAIITMENLFDEIL